MFGAILAAILVAILAAILDLEVTCILNTFFDSFIKLGMVKNIYVDTQIVSLSTIYIKLCQFSCIYRLVPVAILAAILAAMLEFQVFKTC